MLHIVRTRPKPFKEGLVRLWALTLEGLVEPATRFRADACCFQDRNKLIYSEDIFHGGCSFPGEAVVTSRRIRASAP
jgi:hypothetical protein